MFATFPAFPESCLQGLQTLIEWHNLLKTKKTKLQERKLNRSLFTYLQALRMNKQGYQALYKALGACLVRQQIKMAISSCLIKKGSDHHEIFCAYEAVITQGVFFAFQSSIKMPESHPFQVKIFSSRSVTLFPQLSDHQASGNRFPRCAHRLIQAVPSRKMLSPSLGSLTCTKVRNYRLCVNNGFLNITIAGVYTRFILKIFAQFTAENVLTLKRPSSGLLLGLTYITAEIKGNCYDRCSHLGNQGYQKNFKQQTSQLNIQLNSRHCSLSCRHLLQGFIFTCQHAVCTNKVIWLCTRQWVSA